MYPGRLWSEFSLSLRVRWLARDRYWSIDYFLGGNNLFDGKIEAWNRIADSSDISDKLAGLQGVRTKERLSPTPILSLSLIHFVDGNSVDFDSGHKLISGGGYCLMGLVRESLARRGCRNPIDLVISADLPSLKPSIYVSYDDN